MSQQGKETYSLKTSWDVSLLLQDSASMGGSSFTRVLVLANHGVLAWGPCVTWGPQVTCESLPKATQNYKARHWGSEKTST